MGKEEVELYDLEKLSAIGGRSYNHDGQIIRTPHNGNNGGWLYMGDDYEEYSPVDCLIKAIIDYPSNYDITGEITKVELVSTSYADYVRVTSVEDGEESVDDIEYERLSIEVIVNHNTKMEVRRKSA